MDKQCPGCRSLNTTLKRERMVAQWIYGVLLGRTDHQRLRIEGHELQALDPGQQVSIEHDPGANVITLRMVDKPTLTLVK